MLGHYGKIRKKKRRGGDDARRVRERCIMSSVTLILDIAHKDTLTVTTNKEDKAFLADQRSIRETSMITKNKELSRKVASKGERLHD